MSKEIKIVLHTPAGDVTTVYPGNMIADAYQQFMGYVNNGKVASMLTGVI